MSSPARFALPTVLVASLLATAEPLGVAGLSAVQAAPPQQVTLQNNTFPGQLTIHDIVRTIRRTTKRPKFTETLTYQQNARLVQCNIPQPPSDKILCYQMLVDGPAHVVAVFHDKKKVEPTPPALQFNLPRGSTRLTSEKRLQRESPTITPRPDPAQTVLLAALLDVAYWPPKKIDAGHKWERPINSELFDGRQLFQFVDLVEADGQTQARIALKIEGRFKGALDRAYTLGMAEGVISWSRHDQRLQHFEALAEYQRKYRDGSTESFDLKVEAKLRDALLFDENQQETVKEQMLAFSSAIQSAERNNVKEALAACRDFQRTWPKAIWLPAIKELEQQLAPKEHGSDIMGRAQLKDAIARAVVAYEAAKSNHDHDLLDRTIATMTEIAATHGTILAKLCRDKDETTRSSAAFALASAARAQDLTTVHKCVADPSAKVRTMALTGLAASGNAQASAEVLLKALDDSEAGVRRRALLAVAACVPRENLLVAKLVEKIDRLMIHDKNDGVRGDAVAALVAIGAPADVPRLEQALKHELNQSIRTQIDAGIEELRKRQ